MEKQYRDAFSSPLHTAVITYTYDSMNRLVSENCGDSRISYKYDLSGNRISRVTDGRTENYLYNSRNQLTQLTGDDKNISYTYDPAGNLTEEHSTEHKKIYFYDTYNRNTEITGNDFTQKNHYDAEGYRYSIEENDKVTNFVYRRGIMLAELDEAGNQAKTYTLGNEYAGHVSELNNSLTSENKAASYYITDEQGSIRYMLDQSGEVQNYYQYSAFGETIISEETTPNRLRYNAQTEDELTGLYYLRARYYAPNIGRFTQEDVIYNDGLNLYAYCNSNPVMYSDPSGFAKETCKSKVGGECDSESGSGSVPNSLLQGDPNTRVYLGIIDGEPDYVGIAYDVERRQSQHGDRFDYLREITTEPLTRRQARAIEQAMIKNHPEYSNKINSISTKRDWYNDAVTWGKAWLREHGLLE